MSATPALRRRACTGMHSHTFLALPCSSLLSLCLPFQSTNASAHTHGGTNARTHTIHPPAHTHTRTRTHRSHPLTYPTHTHARTHTRVCTGMRTHFFSLACSSLPLMPSLAEHTRERVHARRHKRTHPHKPSTCTRTYTQPPPTHAGFTHKKTTPHHTLSHHPPTHPLSEHAHTLHNHT